MQIFLSFLYVGGEYFEDGVEGVDKISENDLFVIDDGYEFKGFLSDERVEFIDIAVDLCNVVSHFDQLAGLVLLELRALAFLLKLL